MELTERQLEMIKKCKSNGFGWAKFATNIEKQGFCTQKQDDVLWSMCQRITQAKSIIEKAKCRVYRPRRKLSYKHDISDCEAMQSGDFF